MGRRSPRVASPRVAIVVDNPYRDLFGLLLVARALGHHGCTCYLVPVNMQAQELSALRPDFVLFNYLRNANTEVVRSLLEANVAIGVLDTEGQADLDSQRKTLSDDEAVRSRVSCFCAWGEQIARVAREEGWFRKDQIALTGVPRFDLYCLPWRRAVQEASPHVAGYESPLVLLVGSSPAANPIIRDEMLKVLPRFEERIKHFGGTSQFARQMGKEKARRMRHTQGQAVLEMIDLTNHLAEAFPDVTFVFRPHPFEETATYEERFVQRGNLHVDRTGGIDGWLLRASAVIQRGSTVGLEAVVAGTPVIMPEWVPSTKETQAYDEANVPAKSEAEVVERLRGVLKGKEAAVSAEVKERRAEVMNRLFYKIDGKAHRRVAGRVLKHLDGASVVDRNRLRRFHYGLDGDADPMKDAALKRLKALLGWSARWSFRRWKKVGFDGWEHSHKEYNAGQVEDLLEAAERCVKDAAERELRVHLAEPQKDYAFGYEGRSVVVRPAEKSAEPEDEPPVSRRSPVMQG